MFRSLALPLCFSAVQRRDGFQRGKVSGSTLSKTPLHRFGCVNSLYVRLWGGIHRTPNSFERRFANVVPHVVFFSFKQRRVGLKLHGFGIPSVGRFQNHA